MSLDLDQISRLARLSRIEISAAEAAQTRDRLNEVFALIEQLQAVDTREVAPMAHAMDLAQRLRDDRVTEGDRHEAYQALAPEAEAGLYLVPRVVE